MSRYDRQTILPEIGVAGQARLAAAHVLVIGAGGLGATVIPALAGAGVGRLSLIDPDTVSESNLHRQTIFTMADLGRPKVACAADYVAALNPEVRVDADLTRLDPANVARVAEGADLVIDAADSFAATYVASDHCREAGLPFLSASVLGRAGYAGGFCGGAPSYRALFPELPQRAQSCATAGVMGPAVACLGALQAQMALSVLLGLDPSPLGQMVMVDLASYRFNSFRFDGAPEPAAAFPFIAADALRPGGCVVELRGPEETAEPVVPWALRMSVEDVAAWTPPPEGQVVLCCRSGLRAWRAAQSLQDRGRGDLALLAAG